MTGRWSDLGPPERALVEAAFVALESAALEARALADAPGAPIPTPSPSVLWAHVTGSRPIPPAGLAAALLKHPGLRDTLAGLLGRAAVAVGPRVAAAATGPRLQERRGDGFRLLLLPARGTADQTWIVIALDGTGPAPTRLTALPANGPPASTELGAPADGTVQVLIETDSALVRALADPTSDVFLL